MVQRKKCVCVCMCAHHTGTLGHGLTKQILQTRGYGDSGEQFASAFQFLRLWSLPITASGDETHRKLAPWDTCSKWWPGSRGGNYDSTPPRPMGEPGTKLMKYLDGMQRRVKNILLVCTHMRASVHVCMCGAERTPLRSGSSPSTFMWVSGINSSCQACSARA